jgi:hypothetical protein
LDKFRDKEGNRIETSQWVKEDKPKIAVRYSLQEDETEGGKWSNERQKEWVEGTTA